MNIKELKNLSSKETDGKNKNTITYIVKGTITSIIITLIMLLIFSVILANTNINEETMFPIITTITAISIVIGGIVSTKNIEKKGIIIGAITGLFYIITIYLCSSIIVENFAVNLYSIILISASIVAGMFGGIIGVNLK